MTYSGHDLVDRLIGYKNPDDPLKMTLESFREDFRDIGHRLVDIATSEDELKRAIYKLQEASQAVIFALVVDSEVS